MATVDRIEASMKQWLSARPNPLVIKYTAPAGSAALKSLEGRAGINLHWSQPVEEGRWALNVLFDPPLKKTSTLEEARSAFNCLAVDSTPLPGWEEHEGWRVMAQVPVSSFKEGVSITSWDGERMGIHAESYFFSLYGRRKDIHPPADAGMPEGTYIQVREHIDYVLELDVPVEI